VQGRTTFFLCRLNVVNHNIMIHYNCKE
jgi:hypothetical protein